MMRTALVVAFVALALQPGGPTRGAGDEVDSVAQAAEVTPSPLPGAEYCGRLASGRLTAQAAVLENEVQLVLDGTATASDF
jgi:hypothetical protein